MIYKMKMKHYIEGEQTFVRLQYNVSYSNKLKISGKESV